MKRTFAIEFCRCGWGVSAGEIPELRLGWVRFWCCRGSIFDRIAALHRCLADAASELKRGK